jgi:hypothetical protein
VSREIVFYVEGQTEEAFVYHILGPYFSGLPHPVTVNVKLPGRQDGNAGGGRVNRSFALANREIRNHLRRCVQSEERAVYLTTMLDLYALAPDAPGLSTAPVNDPYARVAHVETALSAHFGDPHLALR